MRILSVAVLFLAAATSLFAADPEGFGLWKGALVQNSEPGTFRQNRRPEVCLAVFGYLRKPSDRNLSSRRRW